MPTEEKDRGPRLLDGRFRRGVDRCTGPLGEGLRRTRLAPDHLTAFGLALSIPTAVAIGSGHLRVGLVLLVFSAVPDLLDGALAKASGRASVRGAFFDSVCDRVSDSAVLGGMAWYLQDRYGGHAFILPFAILGASFLISYERAKAESLGFQAKGGLMERAERIVVLCVGLAFSVLLVPLLWVMLVLTVVTVGQRFVKVWSQAEPPPPAPPLPARRWDLGSWAPGDRRRDPSSSPAFAPMAARWRAWRESGAHPVRPERRSRGTRPGSASERWRQRRLARHPDGPGGLRRRGSRRP